MELKEKPKTSKEKDKAPKISHKDKPAKKTVSPVIPQKQASRMMKEKYIRDLKDRPKDKDSEKLQTAEQAAEQVEDSGRWAVGELTGTTRHMAHHGREYAKKKSESTKKEKKKAPIPPVDDLTELPDTASPEAMPPDGFKTHLNHVFQQTSFSETAETAQSCPGTAPKEQWLRKRPTPPPKERQETRPKPLQTTGEKPSQSEDIAKPSFKERPLDFRIRERPPAAAPKEPGTSMRSAAVVRRDRSKSGEATPGGAYENKTPAAAFDYRTHKPKTAVPPEYRRALLEKKKASPYAAHDSTPFAPPDAPPFMDASVSLWPSSSAAPSQASLTQARSAASMKDILVDKTRKSFKERPHFSQKKVDAENKPTLTLKTRRTSIKPIVAAAQQGTPTAPQRAVRAAHRQVQRKMLDKPKKAVRSSVEALRRIVQVVAKTVSTVTGAVTALVGGGILLTAVVIVIVIAAVANSPFGLFYAQEPNAPGTVSVAQAVGSVNAAYNARLEELQTGDSYDSIDIQGHTPDWTEVLAVFAVKLAGADVDGLDVATLDSDRVNKLIAIPVRFK